MEDINESVENQEVAEPETDVEMTSEDTQEAADPVTEDNTAEESNGRTKQDAAFAEQRRRIKELEERERELNDSNKAMFDALSRYFDGDTAEDLSIQANAYAENRDPDEVRAEFEHNREFEQLKADKAALEEELMQVQVEKLMQDGLKEVQEIDPDVKSLDELGESFFRLISAGCTTKEAYYASQVMASKETVHAPDAIGRVSDTRQERDYYTSEELDNLSDEEMEANWDKVMNSMKRLR